MNTQIKNKEEKPLVAIHCMVYNHAPFLRECFEGFVMQQTTFPFVAIVHDDASTDDSADIIREYETKYPHIFKPIYQTVNQHSIPGVSVVQTINKAIQETGAKYIAMCEGDDYWTDPLKLQKQVDFLEANPEYSFCCHRFKILQEKTKTFLKDYANSYYTENQNLVVTEDIFFSTWVSQWLTTLVKADMFIDACNTSYQQFGKGLDVYLYFLLLQSGPGISLYENMGVYRWHENGAAKGLHGYARFRKGYNTYSTLLGAFPNDELLQKRVRYYAIGCLGFMSFLQKENRDFYKENKHLFSTNTQIVKAMTTFLTPPFIWNFFRKMYRNYSLKAKLS